MLPGRVIVLDVGKTLAKLSLWTEDCLRVDSRDRYNARVESAGHCFLDTEGIERWMVGVLAEFARMGPVTAIVPVAHGAAAAVVRGGRLACPVRDYEEPVEPTVRSDYERQRDSFARTGSPALPDGLNLGMQLHCLEREHPEILCGDARILTWPQYWAWRLCGVAAAEVSSLGCHTDLWYPGARRPSDLAISRGWAERLPPLRRADEVLGTLSEEWVSRTGLSREVRVYCGMHDSNASLLAARSCPEIAGREATVIATGTWFVAMRTPTGHLTPDLAALPQSRDCLVNVDVFGQPVPSARFMGGRELELLGGLDGATPEALLAALPAVLAAESMVLPTWVSGVGPYPNAPGRWLAEPDDPAARGVAAALYAALMTDTSLELIGARDRLLVEGRFGASPLFMQALATLQRDAAVLVNGGSEAGVAIGALRLVDPTVAPPAGTLERIAPLAADLAEYKRRWCSAIGSAGRVP